jgi:DNA-binding NtrC family response regulator
VGKELVAGELHARSARSGAFIPVNCGALPTELVESEFFGHVEGAFTGAKKRAAGRVGARVRRVADPALETAPLEIAIRREGTPLKEELSRVFERYEGNVSQVAGFFGKERAQVYRWMRRYGLDPASFRKASVQE